MNDRIDALEFATVARTIGSGARSMGLRPPTFRSPPRVAGAERTLKRSSSGWTTVAVRLDGRPPGAVVADMVEGVIVANRLTGAEATRARTALWEAVVATPVGHRRAA
ncbi:MAG: hypothetical protein JST73_10345 [Actinobacteria bacterium]|nr:hypothetical protein [Actinomycetota bacterium]